MRGGISMGKLIHTKEYLFGPAFIDAYDIESKKAIYPRIICDESIILLSQSGKPLQSALQDLIIFIEIIRQDTDNYWYIDYIENVQSLFDTYEEEIDYLNEIGKFTEKCLLENPKGKVNKKYKWLRNKYNETLKRKLKNKELKLKNPDLYSIIKSLKLIK